MSYGTTNAIVAILVASGLYISFRERHLGLRRVRPPETTT